MRIKSYFAPSVQSAISVARREFGDDVTLVTSHSSSLESRHLGDYEVVFAVEEPEDTAKSTTKVIKAATATAVAEPEPMPYQPAIEPTPAVSAIEIEDRPRFADVLQQVAAAPLSTEENLPEKLARVETVLVEMGIDGPMVRALMTMIERSVGAVAPVVPATEIAATEPAAEAIAEAEPEPAAPALPDLTPAELAFYLSVSVGA